MVYVNGFWAVREEIIHVYAEDKCRGSVTVIDVPPGSPGPVCVSPVGDFLVGVLDRHGVRAVLAGGVMDGVSPIAVVLDAHGLSGACWTVTEQHGDEPAVTPFISPFFSEQSTFYLPWVKLKSYYWECNS